MCEKKHKCLLLVEDVELDGTAIRFGIEKVEVVFEGVLPGCLSRIVTIKDCETGKKRYVSPSMVFATKDSAIKEARRQLSERIASSMSDINKTMLCVDEARSVLASII